MPATDIESIEAAEAPPAAKPAKPVRSAWPAATGTAAGIGRPDGTAAPRIGRLLALLDDGRAALVTWPARSGFPALRAESVVDLAAADIGRRVLLVFEDGEPARPVITGLIRGDREPVPVAAMASGAFAVEADGERLVVSASERLVLRCGDASITLTRGGKVLIRGRYVVSEASGTNRVRGGSVQLN